ncbi:MAG: hypothetical protein QN198_00795 [Armatimonadota bacterium]|nr:hypothetical protein [Armatimonadota bacterium]MDR5702120.1 hypothetical protein [Armatimonadota bacterium]MDR7435109.1 hypothetical protein [Armatimonadota bacterium]
MRRLAALIILAVLLAGVLASVAVAASGVDFYPGDDPPKASGANGGSSCKNGHPVGSNHPPYNDAACEKPGQN